MNRRDATLQRVFPLLVVIGLLVLAALAWAARAPYLRLAETARWAERTRTAVPSIESLSRAVIDAEPAQRGVLLGSSRSLDPSLASSLARYRAAVATAQRDLDDIAQRMAGDDEQLARLARIRAAAEATFARLDRAIALASSAPAQARDIAADVEEQRLLGEVRDGCAAMVAQEGRRFDERVEIARATRHATELFAGAALVFLALVIAGATVLISRELRLRSALAADLREGQVRLGKSERLLRAINDSMPALIAYVDKSQTYRFVNAAYRTVFGVAPDDFLGRTLREMLSEPAYATVEGPVAAALRGEPQQFELVGVGRMTASTFVVNLLPDVNAQGGVDGFHVMSMDITARKQAELELARSERRLRTITDNMPAQIGYIDSTQHYRFTNAAYTDIYGVPPEFLIGRTTREMMGPVVHARMNPQIEAALRGERRQFEQNGAGLKTGSVYVITYVPDINADGEVEGFYSMSLDITARKAAELELANSERRLRTITDNLPATIALFDTRLRCVYANDCFRHLYGVDPATMIGSTQRAFRGEAEWAELAPHVEAVLRGERREFELLATARGEPHWMLQSLIPESDAQGHVTGYLSVAFDITERKRQEEALRRSELFLDRSSRLARMGAWEVDIVMQEIRWSDETRRIHGVAGDYQPTFENALAFYEAPARAAIEAAVDAALRDGTPWDLEIPLVRADGRRLWVRGVGSAERRDGRTVRLIGALQDIDERVAQRLALQHANDRIALATESGGIGIWEIDIRSGGHHWDPRMYSLFGDDGGGDATPLALWDERVHPDDLPALQFAIDEAAAGDRLLDREFRVVLPDGRRRHLRGTARMMRDAEGRPARLIGATWDITELRQLAADLAEDRSLLSVTLESIGDAVITTNARGAITWLNPVAERLTGWLSAEAKGRPLGQVFHIVDEQTREPAPDPVALCIEQGRVSGLADQALLLSRDGQAYGIEDSVAPIRSEAGEILGVILVFHDVSEQRRLSGEMSWRATHDALTGLVNRAEFEARLTRLFERARSDESQHAMLYIDLDQFKLVNDACGHAVGDQLLQQMARLLTDAVRLRDTIARLGGDEFAIIMEHCDGEQALHVAQKICDRMDDFRFIHEERRFRIGTSIGLVPIDGRWSSAAAIQQAADTACYAAKEAGRNRVHAWFDTDTAMRERQFEMQWTTRIEQALDEDGFMLFAQRVESLKGAVVGVHAEVLLRMRQIGGGVVAPGAFLPAAERFHLAPRIDRWVLRSVVEWMAAQREPERVGLLSVNLSGQSVGDRSFHRWALELLAKAGPRICRALCLEITETAAVTHIADAAAFIDDVRAVGVRVALDDFGAGAASFGYLKTLRVDLLKIDGQFVRDLVDDPLDEAAVRCFADVAKVMGLQTVAEFVDKPAVLQRLKAMDIDFAQGFLLHEPEPIDALTSAADADALA